MTESNHHNGAPRTRQQRKRVLNVLAQRRYRERKRQRRLKKQPQDEPEDEAHDGLTRNTLDSELQTHINCDAEELDVGGIDGIDSTWPGPLSMSMTPLPLNSAMEPNLSLTNNEWNIFSSNSAGEALPLQFFASSTSASSPPSFGTSPGSTNSDGSLSDSYLLPVYELTLLKGLIRIAERLGSPDDVWSLTSQSPFTKGGGTPAGLLPPTWQPTATQVLMPHHPFLDFLPWPSVRDKVINIFCLPEGSRPPSAAGPTGLANLAYDVEDNSEGVRIYGDDPYDPACWEVGQVFFQRWWFLFDRDIIATSNRWRRLRGAPPLAIKAAGEEDL
ncbi:hypothetical protein LMH87_006726 [Akanthomyces muscarius]|uniref:BZIP domain-containing protein n=1 Tax=Akanthomyces muscarius TaxID=2231603 RepID=A0A9W8QRD0_AKAMU|nr:hypothetical protein LMH87_006726 [Akanthomyces muscarius]KAJ4165079.1 hypothetical protein LMH87_006726 [Akanthomyces muscarius]